MELKSRINLTFKALFLLLFVADVLSAQDYFPITPGTEWTYGNAQSGAPNLRIYISDGEVEWDGEQYYQMKGLSLEDSLNLKSISSVLLRKGRNGDLYGINLSVSEDEYLFFPGKPKLGYSWTGLSGLSKITSAKGTLETPVGTFENCMIVESIAGGAKAFTYYQINKGMVAVTLENRILMYLIE
ncbi:MAG: hypothetical protein ACJAQ4_000425 [Cryomorphaceae bacterium]|jgi:hypothetical protein